MIASRLDQFSNEHTLDKFATFALAQYQNKCAVMLNVVTIKIWEGQTVLVRKIMTKRETIWLIKRTQRPHLSLPQKLENAFKRHLVRKILTTLPKICLLQQKIDACDCDILQLPYLQKFEWQNFIQTCIKLNKSFDYCSNI